MRVDALPPRSRALPALTGIRGIAAMAVFLCHLQPTALRFFGIDPNASLSVIGSGFRGVELFFVLSGFILFHVHWQDFGSIDGPTTRRFYLLRFFRVYPLNTIVLLLLVPLPVFLPEFVQWHRAIHMPEGAYHLRDFSVPAFVQSLLLAQTWTVLKLGTWNEPAWTLSAEVLGYACFPVLAYFVGRLRSGAQATSVALCSLAAFVLLMVAGGHATNNPTGTFGVIRMAFCFVAGIGLCRTFHLTPGLHRTARILTPASAVLIAVCFWQTRIGILSVFGFAGLIFGLAYQIGPINAFMTSRPVMWLGRISFSFYIVHQIPLELFEWVSLISRPNAVIAPAMIALLFAGAVVTPFVMAALTYRYVELPFQKLGRHIATRAMFSDAARQVA